MQVLRPHAKCTAVLGLLCILSLASAETKEASNPLQEAVPFKEHTEHDAASTAEIKTEEAKIFIEAAAKGDADAILRVGLLYESGKVLPQDYAKAREHYQRAVAEGLPEGHFHLALCMLEGWGGPVDKAGFARELQLAADAGYAPAQRVLAAIYFIGFTVPKNDAEGKRWLEAASASDDVTAQVILGQSLEKKTRKLTLVEDMERAKHWYMLSAEKDYHVAMRALCRSLLLGRPEQRNWELATHWLDLATEGGDRHAPYTRAFIELFHPNSPLRSEPQTLSYLKLAAERSNPDAANVLQLVEKGYGLTAAMKTVLLTPEAELYVLLNGQPDTPDTGTEDKAPAPLFMAQPDYPQSLRLFEVEGDAMISFTVEIDGTTSNRKLVSTTHPLFGEAALECVRTWRFTPGKKMGHPAPILMQIPISFRISDETVLGVKEILADAKDTARTCEQIAAADTSNLTLAIPIDGIPSIAMSDGSLPGNDVYCRILLVVQADGHVARAHVLSQSPGVSSRTTLNNVAATRFKPRMIAGIAEQTNCVLVLGAVEKLYPMLGIRTEK